MLSRLAGGGYEEAGSRFRKCRWEWVARGRVASNDVLEGVEPGGPMQCWVGRLSKGVISFGKGLLLEESGLAPRKQTRWFLSRT